MALPESRMFYPGKENDMNLIRGRFKVYAREVGDWTIPRRIHYHAYTEKWSICMAPFPAGGICEVEEIVKGTYFYVTHSRYIPDAFTDRWLDTKPGSCIEVRSLYYVSKGFPYALFMINNPTTLLLPNLVRGLTIDGRGPVNPLLVSKSFASSRVWDAVFLFKKDGSLLQGRTRHDFLPIMANPLKYRVVEFHKAPTTEDIGTWVYEIDPGRREASPSLFREGVLAFEGPIHKSLHGTNFRLTGIVTSNFWDTDPPNCAVVYGYGGGMEAMFEDMSRVLEHDPLLHSHPSNTTAKSHADNDSQLQIITQPGTPYHGANSSPESPNQAQVSSQPLASSLLNQPIEPAPQAGQPSLGNFSGPMQPGTSGTDNIISYLDDLSLPDANFSESMQPGTSGTDNAFSYLDDLSLTDPDLFLSFMDSDPFGDQPPALGATPGSMQPGGTELAMPHSSPETHQISSQLTDHALLSNQAPEFWNMLESIQPGGSETANFTQPTEDRSRKHWIPSSNDHDHDQGDDDVDKTPKKKSKQGSASER
ncbi:hypothetical protein HD806DRAFT_518848 [Xylariaceae sp. AK1471]|nr:hypothetical protein HD806DRAFT_518848 [Xylariaceae sp. AK1471]